MSGNGIYSEGPYADLDTDLVEVVEVPIRSVRPGNSPRLGGEDDGHVHLLSGLGEKLPPITVLRSTMEVIDGAHRLRAAQLRGDTTIRVRLFEGSRDEAFVLSVALNVSHGLPLSRNDRTAAAARIVHLHPEWSDRRVAAVSGLSATTVAALRARHRYDRTRSGATRIGLDGKARPLDPAEGRRQAAALIEKDPDAPLRDIAATAGISVGTAKDVRDRMRRGEAVIPARLRERSSNVAPNHSGRELAWQAESHLTFAEVIELLHRDPALRLSEMGRVILRLLGSHRIDEAEWNRLANNVPAHCSLAVARAARHCAEMWIFFGNGLENRVDVEPS